MTVNRGAISALAALAAWTIALPRAEACGSSGPDGVSACSLADHEEAVRPRWRLGASGVYTSTALRFSSTLETSETRYAGLAEATYVPTARLTLNLGLGAAVGGRLVAPDGPHDFAPGFVSDVGASYRVVEGDTRLGRGFVIVSAVVSFTASTTRLRDEGVRTPYDALDFRAGVVGGFTWWRVFSAYAVVRAFGGPVFWSYEGASQVGTDTHHYQVGGGLALLVLKRVDLFTEGVPLGEQAIAAGASVAF